MKMTINRESLLDALGAPASVASGASVPYLACVLLEAAGGSVSAEGTNLCESVRCEAPALVEEDGRALVPAKMLSDVVKSLPSAAVTLEGGADGVEVTCGKASFEVPALDPGDFPRFPSVTPTQEVHVGAADLKEVVGTCRSFAAGSESKSDVLGGVRVSASGGSMRAEATDSYRAARTSCGCGDGDFDAVLPSAIADMVAGLKCGGDAVLSRSESQVGVTTEAGAFVSRVVEGRYPDVGRLFPAEPPVRAEVGASDAMAAVRRALAVGGSKPAVLTVGGGLRVERSDGESGSYSEDVECASARGECRAGINARYLRDAIAAAPGDEVEIGMEDPIKPILITSGTVEMVVMPVRLGE